MQNIKPLTEIRFTPAAGENHSTKKGSRKADLPPIPPGLADVALIDAATCAAAAGVSISHWLTLVAKGEAPGPAIRAPRYTRWEMATVRAWLIERAAKGIDPKIADALKGRATKASAAAQTKRRAVAAVTGVAGV